MPEAARVLANHLVGDGPAKLGYVTNDREAAIERVQAELGFERFVTVESSFEGRAADGRTGTVSLSLAVWIGEHAVVELIEPVGGLVDIFTAPLAGSTGFQLAFHHYGVQVDDIEAARADAVRRGLRPALESVGGEEPISLDFMEVPLLGQYIEHFHRTPESLALIDAVRSQIEAAR